MITIRYGKERGPADLGWLKSMHTFSFGHYHDPKHMGFGPLRVINEDHVAPGKGFGTHPHQDMEIVSYVLGGALEHKDSMGTGSIIHPGEIQRMSAGTGVTHSEFNHSQDDDVHFLQIWFLPSAKGLEPGYEQKGFDNAEKRGQLKLVLSQNGRDDTVKINQDIDMYVTLLDEGERAEHKPTPGRLQWIQVARGTVYLNGQPLAAGDGAAIEDEDNITLDNAKNAEILMFDMVKI